MIGHDDDKNMLHDYLVTMSVSLCDWEIHMPKYLSQYNLLKRSFSLLNHNFRERMIFIYMFSFYFIELGKYSEISILLFSSDVALSTE